MYEATASTPVAVRITLNLEMDQVVIVVGDLSVGLSYENGLAMADQLATALETMQQNQRQRRERVS
jgi:hypothetical protein